MNNEETNQKVTAYVVKYALTAGIKTVEARIYQESTSKRRYIHWTSENGCSRYVFGEGKHWTLDRFQAVGLANGIVAKAINQTKAKLERLKKLTFD